MGSRVGREGGYTGTQAQPVPGPIFKVILKARPYPRPNEGLFMDIDEVS